MTNSVSATSSSYESPAHALLAMMLGAAQTQLLSVAAQLRLPDLVQAGTTAIADLAAATSTSVPALSRVMHALTQLGLFVETAPQQFACTPVGALLQSNTPESLREYAIHFGYPLLFRTWPHLLHSVLTGTSAFADLFGIPVYTYLQQHPADAAVFLRGLDLGVQTGGARPLRRLRLLRLSNRRRRRGRSGLPARDPIADLSGPPGHPARFARSGGQCSRRAPGRSERRTVLDCRRRFFNCGPSGWGRVYSQADSGRPG